MHFYCDVTLPAGQPYLNISAWIRVNGESGYDWLDVFVLPTSVTPVAGTPLDLTYTPLGRYSMFSSTWTQINRSFCGTAGQSYRIIFSWRNDGSVGTQPPAAVDRVHITASATSSAPWLVNVPSLPYTHGAGNTCGNGNNLTSSNAPVCGSSSYYGGEDMVWVFTPTTSGQITIQLTSSTTWTGLMLYQGGTLNPCGGLTGGTCIAQSQDYTGDKTLCANVVAGQTYYLHLDYWPSPDCGPFQNLTISAPSSAGGTNACGSPTFTSFPVVTTGSTAGAPSLSVTPTCAGSVGGGCSGGIPGRWYQFVPTSPNMTIHVAPGTLLDPAVAVFTASSCSGPFTQIACNDDGPSDCEATPRYARLSLTGLTVGQVYYIAVFSGNTLPGAGDYTLAIWETGSSPPAQYGQDCLTPIRVCNSQMTFASPGFLGSGFICDVPYPNTGCNHSCLLSGERNIVFLQIPISGSGNLTFTISPGLFGSAGFHDWALWRIDNLTNPCQAIRNGLVNTSRCNWLPFTMCDGSTNAGIRCTGCRDNATCTVGGQGWQECLPVSAGQVYLLAISNWSTSSFPGFTINFGSSPIDYGGSGGTAVWTGGANTTAWNNATNWGGCGVPNSCTQDAIIYGGAANQPVIAAAETWTVRHMTVPAGAKLTVNGTLRVCGHLTVNGELEGTGWIEFYGTNAVPVQEIRGILTGPTQYIPNLRINRQSAGSVQLMTNVQVNGHVEIANSANNTLNLNAYTLFVRGNFTNGASGIFQHGNGTVVFNGGAAQQYTDPGIDPFYNVEMNQSPASTLTINNRMDITNQLTLTSGRIVTGTNEVRVTNTATTAVTPGNANSYVQGNLRRYIGGVGAYDFPVGTSSYQRANINFTSAPNVHNILGWFNNWSPSAPTPPNPTAECGAQYHNCTMLNNGYWTLDAYNSSFSQVTTSGTYTLTLYNTAYTICTGAQQFGVLKNTGSGWFIQNPGCHANTSAATVQRPGMSGFSNFGTGQSTQPLPVSISRWEGHIRADEAHVLRWEVLEEAGSRVSHFVIEAGISPGSLQPWRTFSAERREAVRENPPFGASYYRLRIHTTEGAELHTSVLELVRRQPEASLRGLEAFPNPTTGELTVRFLVGQTEPVRLTLWNALGQVVIERTIPVTDQGWLEVKLSLSDLPVGPYMLRVEQNGDLNTKIIQRH